MKTKLYALLLVFVMLLSVFALASCDEADGNDGTDGDGNQTNTDGSGNGETPGGENNDGGNSGTTDGVGDAENPSGGTGNDDAPQGGTASVAVVSFIADDTVFGKQSWLIPSIPTKVPSKYGYKFEGWYLDKDVWQKPFNEDTMANITLTENTNVYAKFSLAAYKIYYNLNGGTLSAENSTEYTSDSVDLVLGAPTRAGYTFLGWYDGDKEFTSIGSGRTGDITLEAKWSFKVSFNAGGGTGNMASETYTYGETSRLPINIFAKTDYIFAGWKDASGNTYYNASEISENVTGNDELVLTAQWRGGFGFDIYNGQSNFNYTVGKNNTNYLIIRAGHTWINDNSADNAIGGKTMSVDESFVKHYNNSKAAGIPLGAYWYSCAYNAETGRREAEFLYENCLKGRSFEFPIYMDVESSKWQKPGNSNTITGQSGTINITKQGVTDAINAFCGYLLEKGYFPAVYTYQSFIENFNAAEVTAKYDIWYAYYAANDGVRHDTNLKYNYGTFDMWQFAGGDNSTGGGYKYYNGGSTVQLYDANYVYKDYETFMKRFGLNGFTKEDPNAEFKTYEQLAEAVQAGLWGDTEAERKYNLIAAGFDYNGVSDCIKYLP